MMTASPASASGSAPRLDVERVRRDFPALHQRVHGKPLVYLDSAATAHKPQAVLDATMRFYSADNANVHRGVHELSERATRSYEGARETVRRFLNAADTKEIIFVRGATEAVNLIAQTFGRKNVKPGDEIVITAMEHHSNIVPWQLLCEERGAVLKVAPINDRGELQLEALEALLTPKTRLLAAVHVSNALGTINPVKEMIALAHQKGVPVLLDGAQAVPHLPVDVRALDCDFYVFSGHKVFGPTGIGVLYGKAALLEAMPPYQGGGDMILSVSFDKTVYNRLPYRFEAGTPNIAGAIGLGAALEYVEALGREAISAYEHELLVYGTRLLEQVPGLSLVGTARVKAGILSFVLEDVHPHDLGTILDREGIAIRSGHHCAQPLMQRFGVAATARASLAFYNTREELDTLAGALKHAAEVFR
jgi:cysteine desulfurase/selenocysteine lyase